MKTVILIIRYSVILVVILVLCGCSLAKRKAKNKEESNKKLGIDSFVTDGVVKNQLALPEKGEQIVVFHVKDYGVIKCRLFPEAAPNSVKKFVEFVKAKKYDGALFYRVVEDFVVQGGISYKEKSKDESQKSQIELNKTLHHFNGALCMARDESKTKGQETDFYFVSSQSGKKTDFETLKNRIDSVYKRDGLNITVDFDEKTKKIYKTKGGRPDLDMQYTVFGQAIEGLDVIKKIENVPKRTPDPKEDSKEAKNTPKEPVVIEKVEIVTF